MAKIEFLFLAKLWSKLGFCGRKIDWNSFQDPLMLPNWVLDEYWKNSEIAKIAKLDASASVETYSNRFFVHKNPNLDHNFSKIKNLIFRQKWHFLFTAGESTSEFLSRFKFLSREKQTPNMVKIAYGDKGKRKIPESPFMVTFCS